MYIISPLSKCASPEKSEQFRNYISEIAKVAESSEPDTLAYAWFKSSEDNTVPTHYVRGFEVYKTVEANQITHRASEPYKAFRAAVSTEGLLESPSDLRFWRPTGVGFLVKEGESRVVFDGQAAEQHIVVDQAVPRQGLKHALMDGLKQVAEKAANASNDRGIDSFWVLDRGGPHVGEADADDASVYIFSRWQSPEAMANFYEGQVEGWMTQAKTLCGSWQTTAWKDAGLGFMGR